MGTKSRPAGYSASRDAQIAEGRAYGTLSREGRVPPDIFASGLKMMIHRWRCAGIQGNSATAGEQAAQAAYRRKDVMIADPPVPSSPAFTARRMVQVRSHA